jgi:general stress protein YciG
MTSEKLRGFASMDKEQRRLIASKGGKAAHRLGRAHKYTSEQARAAGRKGGISVSQNRDHMAEIGRKGGHSVSTDREHMAEIGRKGGTAASHERSETIAPAEGESEQPHPLVA